MKSAAPPLIFDYCHHAAGKSLLIHADCFEWMGRVPENTVHAIVTDPPYGVKEYDFDQLKKRANGNRGIWRIPPSFDGHVRSPLPRFTALDAGERNRLRRFFIEWSRVALHALRPGGHVFIATNSFLAQIVYAALVEGGLEFRGQIIRMVRTLRGGDRPKNAEREFPGVSSLPRGCYEPWGLFRKPMPDGMRVSDCLRTFQTGALRRTIDDKPFGDIISSERTPERERAIARHPSIKPQSFLRQIIHAAIPMGAGIVVDPFMGSGSTVAAAEALGIAAIGIERFSDYYEMAKKAVPKLAAISSMKPQLLFGGD
jgi:site-specific DNA-methyltransferase (adenine-specific)